MIHPPLWRSLAMAALAGLLLAAGFPPYHLPLLLPFGIVLLLRTVEGLSFRSALYCGLLFGSCYLGGILFWLFGMFGAAALTLILIAALFPALFCILYASLRRRLPGIPSWVLAAVLWTGIEYFRSELFWLNFGWGGLGYAVVGSPLLAAGASLFGSYGLTFWIVALGGLLTTGMRGDSAGGKAARIASRSLVFLWLVVLYAPAPVPEASSPLRLFVLLVQAGPDAEDDLFKLSAPPQRSPVDVIVWPEYSLSKDPERDPRLLPLLQGVARTANSVFLFGAKSFGRDGRDKGDGRDAPGGKGRDEYRNTAFVMGPDGKFLGRHVKNHTVHFFADGIRGTEARPVDTPHGRLGVAICFDMDFPDVARRLAEQGAEAFIVPSMDPEEWGPIQAEQHRLMFQMRAAECGRWLARADVAGGTSVVAPTGQETARVNSGRATRIEAQIERLNATTLYVRGGWRFGQVCLAVSGVLAALALVKGRRPASM